MMITFMEVKGHMWSHIVNYVPWLQKLDQTISYDNDDLHRGPKGNRGQMC